MPALRRYWFELAPSEQGGGAPPHYGVTAVDLEDAGALLIRGPLSGSEVPSATRVTEDVDVRDLDQRHVVPNMGDVTLRGVWFPR